MKGSQSTTLVRRIALASAIVLAAVGATIALPTVSSAAPAEYTSTLQNADKSTFLATGAFGGTPTWVDTAGTGEQVTYPAPGLNGVVSIAGTCVDAADWDAGGFVRLIPVGDGSGCVLFDSELLPDGTFTFRATNSAASGNYLGDGDGGGFLDLYSTTPLMRFVSPVPSITSPADGATLATGTPTFTGRGGNNAEIVLRDDTGAVVCTTTADATGAWTCTPTTPIADGDRTITPTSTVPGDPAFEGAAITLVVDTVPPTAPVITSPSDGDATNDTTPTFSGTGEDGSTIVLTDEDGNTVCETVVSGGTWSCEVTTPLPEGSNSITPTATDAAGNSTAGTPLTVVVDTTPPASPTDIACAVNDDGTVTCTGSGTPGNTIIVRDAEGASVCEVTVPAGGSWTCTSTAPVAAFPLSVLERDPAGNESPAVALPSFPAVTAPTSGAPTNDTTPTFEGTAGPGAAVELRDPDGNVVCATTADADGRWTCTPATALPEGSTVVTPVVIGDDGTESAGTPFELVIDTTPPSAPGSDTVCAANEDGTATCSGTGDPGDTVVIRDPSGAVVCTVTVPSSGDWTCTTTSEVEAGSLTVTFVDPAGNESEATVVAVQPFAPAVGGGSGPGNGSGPGDGTGSGPAAGGSGGGSGELAFTGADLTGLALAALALLSAGGAAAVQARRLRARATLTARQR